MKFDLALNLDLCPFNNLSNGDAIKEAYVENDKIVFKYFGGSVVTIDIDSLIEKNWNEIRT